MQRVNTAHLSDALDTFLLVNGLNWYEREAYTVHGDAASGYRVTCKDTHSDPLEGIITNTAQPARILYDQLRVATALVQHVKRYRPLPDSH